MGLRGTRERPGSVQRNPDTRVDPFNLILQAGPPRGINGLLCGALPGECPVTDSRCAFQPVRDAIAVDLDRPVRRSPPNAVAGGPLVTRDEAQSCPSRAFATKPGW